VYSIGKGTREGEKIQNKHRTVGQEEFIFLCCLTQFTVVVFLDIQNGAIQANNEPVRDEGK
jgi:hypothetical protein